MTRVKSQRCLGTGEKDFCFYHIWAWWPSCSVVQNHLNKLIMFLQHLAHVKMGQAISEKTFTLILNKVVYFDFKITNKSTLSQIYVSGRGV